MEKICILAIESSTPTLGVGLIVVDSSGHELYYQRLHEGSSQHAEHVLPLLDELLAEAGIERNRLSAVAFG
ncbi:MAG TPA: bifunctional tRNA (adenosine(37)-N6)-threonylcarbamoyltransferase complex dimerization subunit type 1 TsaB/ribosomal-protein-alanine acetyltransferase RimI, partial [Paenalcaligenes sp.]|nr:bifunctional tRNA (adenosine(37)-N6)-threonylcarbamoyltransferase complex dimerization subunit type 1 TsaB/ribosomal-protein-alanine acetyltransferase RimI [Paenalcaligenes sp.]